MVNKTFFHALPHPDKKEITAEAFARLPSLKQVAAVFALLFLFTAFPQIASPQEGAVSGGGSGSAASLPDGFMGIRLGMGLDEVKKELGESPYFNYRGDPDVSMLMVPNRQLIECSGYSFVRKGYFQFQDERLIIITIELDRVRLDFFTMHASLERKYGKASRIDPSGAYWDNGTVMLNLEKPLSVKYMDKITLERMAAGQKEVEERVKTIREEFLELF